MAAVAAAGLGLAWGGWVAGVVVVASAALALGTGHVRRLALAALALVPVAISSLVINALLPAGGQGAVTALAALLRLLAFTLPLTLAFVTTGSAAMVADLEAHGLHRAAAFVLAAALAAVPRAQQRALDVVEAQRARGLDTEGAIWRRARGALPLVAPLVIGSLAEVEERALALEVRAFGAPGRRTILDAAPDSRAQRLARWGMAGLLAGGLALRVAMAAR